MPQIRCHAIGDVALPEQPPQSLVDLLIRLGLSSAAGVERMRGRVRRLARDLPVFESVWVDALAQARVITPYQAAEINAGRGERLALGPYVLLRPIASEGYGRLFSAQEISSRRRVRLLAVSAPPEIAVEIQAQLEQLVVRCRQVDSPHVAMISACGTHGDQIWAECDEVEGVTAAEALTRHGRMPAAAVLEIARQMCTALVATEAADVLHGDVSTAGLVIGSDGLAQLLMPGLRPILRPEEGYAFADLPPAAYDGLAPERAADGGPPSGAAEIYACGCLWWQLLAGRSPYSGGNSLTKLRNALSARRPSLSRLAPDTPAALLEVIDECMRRDPIARPKSFEALQKRLGPSTRSGERALRDYLAGRGGGLVRRPASRRIVMRRGTRRSWAGPAVIATILLSLATWPLWRGALDRENIARPVAPTTGGPPTDDTRTSASDPPGRARAQSSVVQASFNAIDDSANPRPVKLLRTDRAHHLDELDLPPRCIVRGPVEGNSGGRPQINVPRMGLSITAADVRFENIDFVWDHPASSLKNAGQRGAIVHLLADSAEFRGCSFQATEAAATLPVAILWQSGAGRDPQQNLITGQVKLVDCVLARVSDGLACHYSGALQVKATNTLFVGSGALVALDHFPQSDEPVVVAMSQTTVRGGTALACRYGATKSSVGHVSIIASGCVFAPADGNSLLRMIGKSSPRGLLRSIQWSGDGSLITPSVPLAAWSNMAGKSSVLSETSLEIAGLVRSRVEFAGPTDDIPGGSAAVRWQAPLRSIDPPGIDARRLNRGRKAK